MVNTRQNPERITAIKALPEASALSDLANIIAVQTNCSLQDAQIILRAASNRQMDSSAAKETDDAEKVLSMVRSIGLKGFSATPDE